MTFIVDGTNGLTFNNSTTQASAGVVLQVVNVASTTQFSTTSATYVNSGLSASITPKFSTSKILVLFSGNIYTPGGTQGTIYRNGTNIGTSNGFFRMTNTNANDYNQSIMVLDSPATTSSTTYALFLLASSSTTFLAINNTGYSMTLMEIAG